MSAAAASGVGTDTRGALANVAGGAAEEVGPTLTGEVRGAMAGIDAAARPAATGAVIEPGAGPLPVGATSPRAAAARARA
jgi:hypothetical protein